MPKIYCYLGQSTIDKIEEIKIEEGHESTPQAFKEIINLGLKVYEYNKKNDLDSAEKNKLKKEEELNRQHTKYLLRMMSLNADILRCVFDKNQLSNAPNDVEQRISDIKSEVDNFIDGYINN